MMAEFGVGFKFSDWSDPVFNFKTGLYLYLTPVLRPSSRANLKETATSPQHSETFLNLL